MGSEEFHGDKFAGENYANNKRLGTQSLVTVDLFKRPDRTFFFRVGLRSCVKPRVITRYELDLDRFTSESDFLRAVGVAAGAAAEHQDEMYGDKHDPGECAKVAMQAAREILRGL